MEIRLFVEWHVELLDLCGVLFDGLSEEIADVGPADDILWPFIAHDVVDFKQGAYAIIGR